MMTSLGNGEYDFTANEVFISDTPVSKYAGDISFEAFPPGADVTGHPAHENIYTSREVGGATSSTSGIELEGAVNSITPVQVNVENDTLGVVTDVDGLLTEYWPVEWEKDDIINITGSLGAREVTHVGFYGGWRNENGVDKLQFWSTDADIHNCKTGDYIEYPISYYEPSSGGDPHR